MSHLTPSQLEDLTGYRRKACQADWLQANGWCFAKDRTGAPKVAQEEYNRRMLSGPVAQPTSGPRLELVK